MFTRTLSALAATALTVGVVLFSSAPAEAAQAGEEQRSVIVPIGDLDLSSERGQAGLDRRIRMAARSVCDTPEERSVGQRARDADCRSQAIAGAKADVRLVLARRGDSLVVGTR
jgi:UrcA family protein